jgi:hypothetical protein
MVFGYGNRAARRDGSRWLSDARSVGTACRRGFCDVLLVAALEASETKQA